MDLTNKPGLVALTSEDEQKEIKAVESKAGRLQRHSSITLQYIKGSKEKMKWAANYNIDGRLWNLIKPKLPGYTYDGGFPTFTVAGLKDRGLI